MSESKSVRGHKRSGFTLIELVVVIIILATIAGFVIPQVGMIGRSSDMAATAKTQSDVASNIQLFFTLQKRYPQGLDSLLDTTGTLYSANTTNGDTQTHGLPYSGADDTRLQAQLAKATFTVADKTYARSLTRAGFDWVHDHTVPTAPATTNSNNSGDVFRGLIADANGTGNTAPTTIDVAEVTGAALLLKLVPQGLKTGERVVAFGVGPRNTAISKTLTNSPTYPGADGKYYGRYIAYFKVYASGERAVMIGTSDSYGRTPDYTQQQFNESLPDGGRQG
ncbi:MAG: type II secretion system GspH family protein [Planctomycetia bacterium]|nr:type II secretion system GspH family protein [Planctomycetia bacterium]